MFQASNNYVITGEALQEPPEEYGCFASRKETKSPSFKHYMCKVKGRYCLHKSKDASHPGDPSNEFKHM